MSEMKTMMNKLTLLTLLEKQINQEITRLEQYNSLLLDLAKEQTKLSIYQQLIQII